MDRGCFISQAYNMFDVEMILVILRYIPIKKFFFAT